MHQFFSFGKIHFPKSAIMLFVIGFIATSPDKAESNSDLSCLQSKVTISESNISLGDLSSLGLRPLSFTVTNNLPFAISGIYFQYQAFSPNRSVPWIRESTYTLIPGGIEHGETDHLETTAGFFPDGTPPTLVTSMTLIDVLDPIGNQLIYNEKDYYRVGHRSQKQSTLSFSCD